MTRALPETSRSLPIALLRARERVMGPIRTLLQSTGVTEQQWRVLRILDESGPMEPTRIADKACLLLPSLTRILQKLESKRMIERQPDSADRRKQVVRISRIGQELIADNLEESLALIAQVRNRMGAEKYERLLDLLNELDEREPSDET